MDLHAAVLLDFVLMTQTHPLVEQVEPTILSWRFLALISSSFFSVPVLCPLIVYSGT